MYFALINSSNNVEQVIIADQAFIDAHPPIAGKSYIQTDINGISPKNYAGVGYKYRQDLNMFISPQPFASWTLDESDGSWIPPSPYPNDGKLYAWNESHLAWELA